MPETRPESADDGSPRPVMPAVRIHSPANETVREIVRLRDHRRRRRARRVLVDGWREVLLAWGSGLRPCGLFLPDGDDADVPDTAEGLIAEAGRLGRLYRLSDPLFRKISYGQTPRDVVAEFDQPDRTLAQLALPADPLLLILDQIEKPGNLGAVFRSADAAGVDAILISDGTGDLFNPNAIRNSLGTVFCVPAATGRYEQVREFLERRSIRVVAARVESSSPLWSTDLRGPLAIVLGSESDGLRRRWRTAGGRPVAGVQIPMRGRADSLNLAVSATILAYEAIRQRDGMNGPDREDP